MTHEQENAVREQDRKIVSRAITVIILAAAALAAAILIGIGYAAARI